MKCPGCGSTSLRASRQREWNDAIPALLGRRAYRCRSCRTRFHAAAPPEDAAPPGSAESPLPSRRRRRWRIPRRLRRRLLEVAVFALLLVIFLMFLRYLTRERTPASESGSGSVSFPLRATNC